MARERNNIYVGNRYVPVFADPVEWDNLRSYEPLTIVTYQGTSYTSKKQVPVGTALNNTNYWVVTGNYNAQVEEYRQDVEEYRQDVEEYRQDVEEYRQDVEEYREDVITRTTYNNNKYIFITDSYGNPAHYGGWIEGVKTKLGLTEGVDCWSSFASGASFGNGSFLTQLQTITNSLTTEEKNSINEVIVVGDINDYATAEATIISKVQEFENYVFTNYPNCKYKILLAGWGYSEATMRGGAIRTYKAIHRASKRATVINCFYNFIVPTNLDSDMVHPSENGMNLLIDTICNLMFDGDFNLQYSTNYITNFSNAYDLTDHIPFYGELTINGFNLRKIEYGGFRFDNNPITLERNAWTKIAEADANNNEIFENNCRFQGLCTIVTGPTTPFKYFSHLLNFKVEKVNNKWELSAINYNVHDMSLTIDNVIGIYFNFDQVNLGLMTN